MFYLIIFLKKYILTVDFLEKILYNTTRVFMDVSIFHIAVQKQTKR